MMNKKLFPVYFSRMKAFVLLIAFTFVLPFQKYSEAKPQNSDEPSEGKVLLAIFAHPDDEQLVGPVLAKYAREGAEVTLVTATDGSLGVNEYSDYEAGDELAAVRREELKCATERLGIDLIHLDYEDQLKTAEGFDGFIGQSRGILTDFHRIIGEKQPDAIITFGPDGMSNHIDHRIIGASVTQVVMSREWEKTPQLFYFGFPSSALDEQSNIFMGVHDDYLTVRIPYSDVEAEMAMESAQCHASQFSPEAIQQWKERMSNQENLIYLRPFVKPQSGSDNIFEYKQNN